MLALFGKTLVILFAASYSAVKIRPKEEEVYFDIVAVVDPVTRDAQKLAPLLLVTPSALNTYILVPFLHLGIFLYTHLL